MPDPENRAREAVGASNRRIRRGWLEAGAGNEEIEMVAVLTLLVVTTVFAAEVTWIGWA
jgi:hypothetical protein